jgi:hypothetical protein
MDGYILPNVLREQSKNLEKAGQIHTAGMMGIAADQLEQLRNQLNALQARADAAEGLAGMLENILERYRWDMRQDDWEQYTAALAAYKQAGSK